MASLATHYPISLESYVGYERDHHAIFVRINDSNKNCGHLFHVVGTIQSGMSLEIRHNCHDPKESFSQVRRCQEWVAEVLGMLKQKGIMESPDADINVPK